MWHLRNVILAGRDDVRDCHVNLAMLRMNQNMDLGFLTEANFLQTISWELETMERKGVFADDANEKDETPP
jgi:hypothetical protein